MAQNAGAAKAIHEDQKMAEIRQISNWHWTRSETVA
jgi:hypothetical protein